MNAPPALSNGGGQHDFNDFSKNKSVESEANRDSQRMSEHRQPADSSGEENDLGENPGDGSAGEAHLAAFRNPAGQPRHQRIGQQKSTRWTEQLQQAARPGGTEHRHSAGALNQVESKRGK